MGARYVLLAIPDDKQAEQYIQSIIDGKTVFAATDPETGEYHMVELKADVMGLYAYPTSFCTCANPKAPARGAKLGWWVNTCCNKPAPGRQQMPNNLLDVAKHPRDLRTFVYISTQEHVEWLAKHPNLNITR